jgi:hypothetical protein
MRHFVVDLEVTVMCKIEPHVDEIARLGFLGYLLGVLIVDLGVTM